MVERLARIISRDPGLKVGDATDLEGQRVLRLSAPRGTALLIGKGGRTWKALERVVVAASYATGTVTKLILDDPRKASVAEDMDYGLLEEVPSAK